MAPLGPFEPNPMLACAVSGGADSLALLLLSVRWAKARGGSILALTVDHQLRPESAAEARFVARIAAELGAEHRTLLWSGGPDKGSLQARARKGRLSLLADSCRQAGCLHLLLAHHRDDQVETMALRLSRGSNLEGLAGMAPQRRVHGLRLVRPLLAVPKESLRRTLRSAGLTWCEDPSNQDLNYERVRLRRTLQGRKASEQLASALGAFAGLRRWGECAVAETLGSLASFHPAGYARLRTTSLLDLPEPLGQRVLAAVLQAVGGLDYPPRGASLRRLFARLDRSERLAATLGGCAVTRQGEELLVIREAAATRAVPVRPGASVVWDGRFRLTLDARVDGKLDPGGFTVGALGDASRRGLEAGAGTSMVAPVPGFARKALPALRYLDVVVAVPHLNLCRPGGFPVVHECVAMPSRCAALSDFTLSGGTGMLYE